jgi:hypothetical protein
VTAEILAGIGSAIRINNRHNPYLFRDTKLKPIEAPVLEYKKLTAA